ncbi:MAG: AsnC family transcriptional regulator [Chloroflexota bacterium]|nr:MAG: AsnC family transcriptional regulator [Chloroflexota bacterium]
MISKRTRRPKAEKATENGQLDDLDLSIIGALRNDGRETATELARRFGVTEATIRNRIGRLVKEDMMRIVAVADPHKIGYSIDTLIGLAVDADKITDVAEQLTAMEEVRYVGVATGSYDIIIAAYFRSNDEMYSFITSRLGTVPGIRRSESWHLLKVFKRTYDWVRPE